MRSMKPSPAGTDDDEYLRGSAPMLTTRPLDFTKLAVKLHSLAIGESNHIKSLWKEAYNVASSANLVQDLSKYPLGVQSTANIRP